MKINIKNRGIYKINGIEKFDYINDDLNSDDPIIYTISINKIGLNEINFDIHEARIYYNTRKERDLQFKKIEKLLLQDKNIYIDGNNQVKQWK